MQFRCQDWSLNHDESCTASVLVNPDPQAPVRCSLVMGACCSNTWAISRESGETAASHGPWQWRNTLCDSVHLSKPLRLKRPRLPGNPRTSHKKLPV